MEHEAALSWILSRRSIRNYTSETISESTIKEILAAAMHAPSAVNCQPWHFIVSSNKEIFRKVTEIHPHSSFLLDASHAILVCGDEKLQHAEGYYLADCGAATENILLAANALGIGSCWIGVFPRMERMLKFKELFNLPEHIQPFALVSLGYPEAAKKHPDRFREDRIHIDQW